MADRKNLNVAEILDALENDEEELVRDIFIEPPDVAQCTDEDSADEDDGGMIEHLNGRQLQAPATLARSVVAEENLSEESSDADDEHFSTEPPRKKQKVIYKWKKADLPDFESIDFISSLRHDYKDFTCTDFFELFFDEDLFHFFINKSTEYALFRNCPDPKIKLEEIKCFFAILIVTGYNNLPSKKSFWDSCDDMRNNLVYNAMRRDRFVQIMRFIHAANNNNLDEGDKMTKLRPLMNILKRKFLDHVPIDQHMNYDESMIEYFGRHGCKQCIRNKPIRFGYKCWCLNSSCGYLANFEGCIPGSNSQYEKDFGKATAPMISMIDELPDIMKNQRMQFYFDNLFTGIPLLVYLKKRGYGGTGTLRQNRLPKECPIAKVETMKKRARGSYEYATQGDVFVVRWMDNSVVTVASTEYKVSPTGFAERYSRLQHKKVKDPRPHLIGAYNQHMGGTDLMDAHINNYRIGYNKLQQHNHSDKDSIESDKSTIRPRIRVRLPELEIAKFDGVIRKWLSFWGQFKKIRENPEIEPSDKFQYLLQSMHLNSKARQLVESYPPCGENYTKALNALKSRFARDDMLIETYVRGLLDLTQQNSSRPSSSSSTQDLASLYDSLHMHLQALVTLGVTQNKFASILLPMVESALPENLLRIWNRCRAQEQGQDLSKIVDFLRKEVESEERVQLAKFGRLNDAAEVQKFS